MIVGKLLEAAKDDETLGYNAAAGKFENMVAAGIIDPVKVGAASGVGGNPWKRASLD